MDGSSSRLDSSHEDLGGMSSGDESVNRSASYSPATKQKIELGRAKVCATPPRPSRPPALPPLLPGRCRAATAGTSRSLNCRAAATCRTASDILIRGYRDAVGVVGGGASI